MTKLTILTICLITSLPIFSQTDTDSLICIPINQARQAAIELVEYDFCQIERDSLKITLRDFSQIVSNQDSIIQYELDIKNKTLNTLDSLNTVMGNLKVEVKELNENNESLKKERNFLRGVTSTMVTIITIALTR
jgi:hypothetical protein